VILDYRTGIVRKKGSTKGEKRDKFLWVDPVFSSENHAAKNGKETKIRRSLTSEGFQRTHPRIKGRRGQMRDEGGLSPEKTNSG